MSSASDSDNSIDWLASDDEDNESEREPDSARTPIQQQPPSSHTHLGDSDSSCCSSQLKEEGSSWGGISEDPSRGSPSSCTETWDSHASGLCNSGRSERSKGKRTQQAQKRPHSSLATEHRERQRQLVMSNQSEKDRVFTNKCMELQCYIHPLSAILNGLRSGRYRERLSSFQESVAMDRIQRIMGVLQNPCMGERYINIILKMEEMLKSWFPNVKPRDKHTVTLTEETAPSKKPKLSPATTALSGGNLLTANAPPPLPPAGAKALRVSDLAPQGAYASATNLKWLHASPICSPAAEQAQGGPRHLPQPLRDRALTQDNAVSSSTDTRAKTDLAPRRAPPGKINAPCLERLLKSTESIITPKGAGGVTGSSWS